MRPLAIATSLLSLILCLPGLLETYRLFVSWSGLDSTAALHFEYHYFAAGLKLCLYLVLGVASAVYGMTRRRLHAPAAFLGLLVALSSVVALPNLMLPALAMRVHSTRLLDHADSSLARWSTLHKRFPNNESELVDALGGTLSKDPVFYKGQVAIPYSVKLVTAASGPILGPVPSSPGVVICAFRSDYKQYWLTTTTLDRPVGGGIVVFRDNAMADSFSRQASVIE